MDERQQRWIAKQVGILLSSGWTAASGRRLPERRKSMRQFVLILAIAVLSGCGVETATTAATSAAIKKKELEEGQKTQERARQKIDQAMQKLDESAKRAGGDTESR
jgi:uncharacterized protein YceK